MQREAVANLRQVLNAREEELRSAQSHLTRCRQAFERNERKRNFLVIESQRKDDRIEELEESLQKEGNQDGDLEILQASLREAQEEKLTHDGSLDDAANAMTEMMQNLKGIKKELATKDAEIARLKDELRVAESEQYLIADKRRKRIGEKNAAVELVDDTNRRRARMKQKRDNADADVLEYISKASVISERVEIDEGETPATLDRKLERVTRDMVTYSRECVKKCLYKSTSTDKILG